jgi:hypothetical protein
MNAYSDLEIFNFRVDYRYSYEDIAIITGLDKDQVMAAVSRALLTFKGNVVANGRNLS